MSEQCKYFAGLFEAFKSGQIYECHLNIKYSYFKGDKCEEKYCIPCNPQDGCVEKCTFYKPNTKDYIKKNDSIAKSYVSWKTEVGRHFNPTEYYGSPNLDGLVGNYLKTANGARCADCGVIGKHYLVDHNPVLYWFNKSWMCPECIDKVEGAWW